MANTAVAGGRGGSRESRVLQHLGQVDTEAVLRGVAGGALAFAIHRGSIKIRPIKEVVSVEVARSYSRARVVHREEAKPLAPSAGGLNMYWASCVGEQPEQCHCAVGFSSPRSCTTSTSTARAWQSLTTMRSAQPVSSATQLVADGQQHILSDPAMVWCRRCQETSLHRKVFTAETNRDPMARFYRGYYNFAADRRPDAHEFWIGVYSEPALLDLEGIELVLGDIPTDRQFNALRRHCGNYSHLAGGQSNVRRESEPHGRLRQLKHVRPWPQR